MDLPPPWQEARQSRPARAATTTRRWRSAAARNPIALRISSAAVRLWVSCTGPSWHERAATRHQNVAGGGIDVRRPSGEPPRSQPGRRPHAAGRTPAEDQHLRDYSSTFWTANVMELFERAAYYGMNSILAGTSRCRSWRAALAQHPGGRVPPGDRLRVHLRLPHPGRGAGRPVRLRRMLMVAFSLLATGYFAAGTRRRTAWCSWRCSSWPPVGLFKPIITGTSPAPRTSGRPRSAFGIYYG